LGQLYPGPLTLPIEFRASFGLEDDRKMTIESIQESLIRQSPVRNA
jgi:hypothetical protein